MNLMHTNIKIKYVIDGYLPNWPYHLISEDEMFEAFMRNVVLDKAECKYITQYYPLEYKPTNWSVSYRNYYVLINNEYVLNTEKDWDKAKAKGLYYEDGYYTGTQFISGEGFFFDNYPLLDDKLMQPYCDLIEVLQYYINLYRSQLKDTGEPEALPAWIYTYMLGEVISVNSDYRDIHDLIKPLGVDNIDDVFTKCASNKCYEVSKNWVKKHNHSEFAERIVCLTGDFEYGTDAEVAELLRDNSVHYTFSFSTSVDYVVVGNTRENVSAYILDSARSYNIPILYESQLLMILDKILVSVTGGDAKRELPTRPATMFGEPHVVKAVRLLEASPNPQWGTYPYQE